MSNFVQITPQGSSPPTTVVTFGTNTTPGNAIVVFARLDTGSSGAATVTDTGGNTYVEVGAAGGVASPVRRLRIWLATNIVGGANAVTVAIGGSTVNIVLAAEYSGVATASLLDQTNSGSGTSTTPATSSITTGQANTLVVCCGIWDSAATWTPGTGFTLRASNAGSLNIEDQLLSSIQTLAGTYTLSAIVGWAVRVLSLKANTPSIPKLPPGLFPDEAL